MSGLYFLELLKANGYGVDKVGRSPGADSDISYYVCRITEKEIERLTGNKNWKHTALGKHDVETGLFHFSVQRKRRA